MVEHGFQQRRPVDVLAKWEILDLVPFGVYVVDLESRLPVYINRHYRERVHAGDTCFARIYQQQEPCPWCKATELVDGDGRPNGKYVVSEHFNELEDHWYQLHEGTMSATDGRTYLYSVAIDIAEIKDMQNHLAEAHAELALKNRQLERLSVTDRLTGLFNRRKLDEVLALECERSQRSGSPFCIVLCDVDRFKSVNDSHGHHVGDQVLVKTAAILRDNVRKVDTVGRWGGEEFLILCPDTELNGGVALAEKLRAALENDQFPTVGRQTASFGVTQLRPGETIEAALGRADAALYAAKAAGRNRVLSQ